MKLFTIGDSISQGFIQLAAAKTDLFYFTTGDKRQMIFANDTLYTKPVTLMQEIYGKNNPAQHLVKFIQLFKS